MSSPGPANDSARKRRSKTACRQCRQSKVKCGTETTPCARCERMGYDCEFDPQFKRQRNQDRMRDLEMQIQTLQARPPTKGFTHSSATPSSSQAHTAESSHFDQSLSPEGIPLHPRETLPNTIPISSRSGLNEGTVFSVLDIKLSLEDAHRLFATYFEKYHVHIPFLDSQIRPEECWENSRLLFWAIVSVAARESQPDKDFLSRLSPYLTDTLGVVMLSKPMSLGHVQTLLLLSLWPPLNVTFWGDRSMTLASLAVTGAMYLGLHHPSYEQEYTNHKVELQESERLERLRTWVAAVSIAQNLSMDFGLPLRLPFANWKLQEVSTTVPSSELPSELQQYLIMQRHAYYTFVNLPERGDPYATLPYDDALLSLLDKADSGLQELSRTTLTNMSLMQRFRYLSVQLQIEAMYLQLHPGNPNRKQGILHAYHTATSIINIAMSEDDSSEVLTYSPRTTFRTLLCAACIVFKVLKSNYAFELDFNSGQLLYNAATLCMRQQAVHYKERKDLPIRCADILKRLWHVGEISPTMTTSPPEVAVQTRLGASVVYDCLAIFFDRLALHRKSQGEAQQQMEGQTPATGLQQGLDAIAIPDVDPNLIFADLPMDFVWDPQTLGYPDMHNFL